MKIFVSIKKIILLVTVFVVALTACNKLELDPTPNEQPTPGTTPTLASLLDDANFSLLKALATKAGILASLGNTSLHFTVFAPDDNAVTASLTPILPEGVTPAMYIGSLDKATAASLLQYHIIPQEIMAASIPASFPNFEYPSLLNPAPTVSALLRLTIFPSVRTNGAWVNNIPIVGTDIAAVNGVVHKVSRILQPPSKDLWAIINADPQLTYLKAAIARADSGVAAGSRLQDALNTAVNPSAIGSNLTVFAPTDSSMKAFLTGAITQALIPIITQQLIGGGATPEQAAAQAPALAQGAAISLITNFGTQLVADPASIPDVPGFPPNLGSMVSAVLTPTLAKGIVAYHIISSQSGTFAPPGIRVFSVNLPTTPAAVKTLLNSAVSVHPGVTVQAVFANLAPGVAVVSSATVKGAANATASNILINPTVTSDVNAVNGVMHKIDQVLLPQ